MLIDFKRPGRPTEGDPEADSSTDPFASYFRRHFVKGGEARSSEFTQLLAEMRSILTPDLRAIVDMTETTERQSAIRELAYK